MCIYYLYIIRVFPGRISEGFLVAVRIMSLNTPRPSEHPPVRGKDVKTFRWDHRLQIQNLFMAFKRVPRWVMLYTSIKRHAGTPDKNKNLPCAFFLRHSYTPTLRGVYIFVYSFFLSCGDFGGVSSCSPNVHVCAYIIRVLPAELAVQNVVDFFVSTYHELVDITFSYLLLYLRDVHI